MSTALKHLVIVLIFSLPFFTSAVEIAVEELADGACWAGIGRQGELKVVSFNQRNVVTLGPKWPAQLIYQTSAELEHLGFSIQKLDYTPYLHCSGMGHALVLNLVEGEQSLCLWGRWNKEQGEFEQLFLGGNPKAGSAPCLGYRLGELIVAFDGDVEELTLMLQDEEFASMVERIETITSGIVKIILHEPYYLKEMDALAALTRIIGPQRVRYGELNYFQWGVGEFMIVK